MMDSTSNLAMERIEHLVSRAQYWEKQGDKALAEFFYAEGQILAMVMDGADDVFQMRYHRYSSDSFGVEFEITHGDPELMFGGV